MSCISNPSPFSSSLYVSSCSCRRFPAPLSVHVCVCLYRLSFCVGVGTWPSFKTYARLSCLSDDASGATSSSSPHSHAFISRPLLHNPPAIHQAKWPSDPEKSTWALAHIHTHSHKESPFVRRSSVFFFACSVRGIAFYDHFYFSFSLLCSSCNPVHVVN